MKKTLGFCNCKRTYYKEIVFYATFLHTAFLLLMSTLIYLFFDGLNGDGGLTPGTLLSS